MDEGERKKNEVMHEDMANNKGCTNLSLRQGSRKGRPV